MEQGDGAHLIRVSHLLRKCKAVRPHLGDPESWKPKVRMAELSVWGTNAGPVTDGTLAGELCLLAVGYTEEKERHLTGHRGRIAVFQDWGGIKVPSGLPRLEPVGPFTPPPLNPKIKDSQKTVTKVGKGSLGWESPEACM